MQPMFFDTFSDGPLMVIPPHQPPQFGGQFQSNDFANPSFGNNYYSTEPPTFTMTDAPTEPPAMTFANQYSARKIYASTSRPTAMNPSRKRSRDEYMSASDETSNNPAEPSISATSNPPASNPLPQQQQEEEPIYGEGMVLLNPRTGMVLSAESQTGTWFEEQAEAAAAAAPPIAVPSGDGPADNSEPPCRKSQRLDATASGWDDITAANIQNKLCSLAQNEDHCMVEAPSPVQ